MSEEVQFLHDPLGSNQSVNKKPDGSAGSTYYNKGMKTTYQVVCGSCQQPFSTFDKRAKYNNKNRGPMSNEQRQKITESLKKYFHDHPNKICRGDVQAKKVAKGTRGKYHTYPPDYILSLSTRTVRKILARLSMPCSRCGWNEAVGDIHHIHGRKGLDPDNHKNLAYLCPNCHRLVHAKKIAPAELVSFESWVGDKWKQYYYG